MKEKIEQLKRKLQTCEKSCLFYSKNTNLGKAMRRRCALIREEIINLENKYPAAVNAPASPAGRSPNTPGGSRVSNNQRNKLNQGPQKSEHPGRKASSSFTAIAAIIALSCCALVWSVPAHADVVNPIGTERSFINLEIIKQIESSGNPRAYNNSSGARGLYQITDICRRDYNKMTGEQITPDQLFDAQVNERIAAWYINKRIPQMLRHYGKPVTIKNVLTAYNAGISCVVRGKPLPQETVEYIRKYKNNGAI